MLLWLLQLCSFPGTVTVVFLTCRLAARPGHPGGGAGPDATGPRLALHELPHQQYLQLLKVRQPELQFLAMNAYSLFSTLLVHRYRKFPNEL